MYWNLKKTTASLVTSLLAFTTVHAKEAVAPNKGILNPAVQPYANEGLGIFANAELLLWKPRETGLDYASKNVVQSLPTVTFPLSGSGLTLVTPNGQFVTNIDGKVKNPEFNWNFGFQIGLGWNPCKDGWDVLLEWTHLHATASGDTEANPLVNQIVTPEFQSFQLANDYVVYTSADSHWKLDFNTLDLEVGRQYLVSRRLSLRPFVGLRAAWIQQRYNINSQGTDSVFLSPSPLFDTGPYSAPFFSETSMKSNFSGLGPRIGLNTDWTLGAGFSFYGEMALSLMLGHFKSNYKAFSDVFPQEIVTSDSGFPETLPAQNPELTNQISLENSFRATRAATDLGLGIRYRHKFYDDFYSLCIQLGWDHRYFFDQNQFITFVDTESQLAFYDSTSGSVQPDNAITVDSLQAQTKRRGDLSLQGFNLSIRLDF